MDINHISPYIRVAMDSVIAPPWLLRERVIFDYELLYVKEGEILVTVEDKSYSGRPGDIFLFKPKQRHSIRITGNSRLRQPHIHFDLFYRPDSPEVKVSFKPLDQMSAAEMKWFREDITGAGSWELPNKITLRKPGYFEQILFEMIEEYEMKKPFYEMSLKGHFIRLWTCILRENYWNRNPIVLSRTNELDRIKDYLSGSIDRQVTLDELAKEFNVSKYHLNRLYKKAFGVTPIHYHQVLRMEKAKEVVQFTGIPLTAVAERFGFSSINAFSRAFRITEGVPPSFYRERVR